MFAGGPPPPAGSSAYMLSYMQSSPHDNANFNFLHKREQKVNHPSTDTHLSHDERLSGTCAFRSSIRGWHTHLAVCVEAIELLREVIEIVSEPVGHQLLHCSLHCLRETHHLKRIEAVLSNASQHTEHRIRFPVNNSEVNRPRTGALVAQGLIGGVSTC